MPTVAQIFAHTLKEIGVSYVFGVPSGNMIDYIDALQKEADIDFVLVAHEATAAIMADVCGRLTGIPGVCFATFGPGATNLSTGVGGALLDRSPLLAFTDEMPNKLLNRTVQMGINHQQLFFPITKWTSRLSKNNVAELILKAVGIAKAEVPGSVHLGVPAGIGREMVEDQAGEIDYLQLEKKRWAATMPEQLKKIASVLVESKQPIMAVGLAAVRAGVQELLLQFAEKYRIPVVLTPMAKGMFPEAHELYLGVLFHALSNKVAKSYSEADLVLGIGYDPVEFNYEDWLPNVPLIHFDTREVDVDTAKIREVINICGSLETALIELLKIQMPAKSWDLDILQSRKSEIFKKLTPGKDCFGPLTVVYELRKSLPQEGILTVDVGAHLHLIGQQWQTPAPRKLLMTNGWSGMGFAIPAAMAAKMCHPDLPVVALLGDGGFTMTVGELATVKRLKLKIIFVVICDNSLTLIRIKQNKKDFNTGYGTALQNLEEQASNHYFGVPVIRAADCHSYRNALKTAFNSEGSTVIEVVADGTEYNNLVLKPNKL